MTPWTAAVVGQGAAAVVALSSTAGKTPFSTSLWMTVHSGCGTLRRVSPRDKRPFGHAFHRRKGILKTDGGSSTRSGVTKLTLDRLSSLSRLPINRKKVTQCLYLHDRITDRQFGIDPVQVAAAVASALDVTLRLQVVEHSVSMALRDTGSRRNLPYPRVRVLSERKQNLAMVREEGPTPGQGRLYQTRLTRLRHRSDSPRHYDFVTKTCNVLLLFPALQSTCSGADNVLLIKSQKAGTLRFVRDVLQALATHLTIDGRNPYEYPLYPRWERRAASGTGLVGG